MDTDNISVKSTVTNALDIPMAGGSSTNVSLDRQTTSQQCDQPTAMQRTHYRLILPKYTGRPALHLPIEHSVPIADLNDNALLPPTIFTWKTGVQKSRRGRSVAEVTNRDKSATTKFCKFCMIDCCAARYRANCWRSPDNLRLAERALREQSFQSVHLMLWNAWQILQFERERYRRTPSPDGKIEARLQEGYERVMSRPMIARFVARDAASLYAQVRKLQADATMAAYSPRDP